MGLCLQKETFLPPGKHTGKCFTVLKYLPTVTIFTLQIWFFVQSLIVYDCVYMWVYFHFHLILSLLYFNTYLLNLPQANIYYLKLIIFILNSIYFCKRSNRREAATSFKITNRFCAIKYLKISKRLNVRWYSNLENENQNRIIFEFKT